MNRKVTQSLLILLGGGALAFSAACWASVALFIVARLAIDLLVFIAYAGAM